MAYINKIAATSLVLNLSLSSFAYSADWEVVQTSNLSTAVPILTQENAGSSNQALNGIVLDNANDGIVNATQSVNVAGVNVSLEQTGASTNDSVQALNLASAKSVTGLTQDVSGIDSAQLAMDATTGTGNVQALNYSQADGNTADLSQSVTGTTVTAVNSSTGNIQAINYAESGTYSGDLSQVTTLTTLDGSDGMRVNSIQGDVSGVTTLTQTATIGTLVVNGNTVVISHVGP
jgi:hypothetical protein